MPLKRLIRTVLLSSILFSSMTWADVTSTFSSIAELRSLIDSANNNCSGEIFTLKMTQDIEVMSDDPNQNGNAIPFIQPNCSSSSVIIDGQGYSLSRSVSATDEFRFTAVFDGSSTRHGRLNLINITLSNFQLTGFHGGVVYLGNFSNLGLSNAHLFGNSVHPVAAESVYGGAIYVTDGSGLSISKSTINNNSASHGGAIALDSGSVVINQSDISNNSATGNGGGIYISDFNVVDVDKSIFSSNTASNNGGAVYSAGYITINDSTISNNEAAQGAGLFLFDPNRFSWIETSTLSGNIGTSRGAAIGVDGGEIRLDYSTVSDNYGGTASIDLRNGAFIRIAGSLIAGNSGSLFAEFYCVTASGIYLNEQPNLIGDNRFTTAQILAPNCAVGVTGRGSAIYATLDGDIPTPPNKIVAPLSDNGCDVLSGEDSQSECFKTHGLAENSPAIDRSLYTIRLDQRGVSPIDTADLGAFEGFIPDPSSDCYVVKAASDEVITFCL